MPDFKQGPHQGSKRAQRNENVERGSNQSLPQSKPVGDQVEGNTLNSNDGRLTQATRTGIAERAKMRNLRSLAAVWTRVGTSV